MSRFAILLGGDFSLTPRVAAQIAGARVIAADSGIRHAASLGIVPELWTGDFEFGLGSARRGMDRRSAPGVPGRQGHDRRGDRRRRCNRKGRHLARHGRRLRRSARRSRRPASGAGAAAGRSGISDRAQQRRAGRPAAAARRGELRPASPARCSAYSASPTLPASACAARAGRSTASPCRSAPRSPYPTR